MQAAGFLAAVLCAKRCTRRPVVVVVQPACAVRCFFVAGNFFFQAEDGIRDRSPSRGLGDVYKRQCLKSEKQYHGNLNVRRLLDSFQVTIRTILVAELKHQTPN